MNVLIRESVLYDKIRDTNKCNFCLDLDSNKSSVEGYFGGQSGKFELYTGY